MDYSLRPTDRILGKRPSEIVSEIIYYLSGDMRSHKVVASHTSHIRNFCSNLSSERTLKQLDRDIKRCQTKLAGMEGERRRLVDELNMSRSWYPQGLGEALHFCQLNHKIRDEILKVCIQSKIEPVEDLEALHAFRAQSNQRVPFLVGNVCVEVLRLELFKGHIPKLLHGMASVSSLRLLLVVIRPRDPAQAHCDKESWGAQTTKSLEYVDSIRARGCCHVLLGKNCDEFEAKYRGRHLADTYERKGSEITKESRKAWKTLSKEVVDGIW